MNDRSMRCKNLTPFSLPQHVNRQEESMLENLKVQDALEECKVVRRPIIRYIQVRGGPHS